jgi:hypothetical protein
MIDGYLMSLVLTNNLQGELDLRESQLAQERVDYSEGIHPPDPGGRETYSGTDRHVS